MSRIKKINRLSCVLLLFIVFCSIGITGVQVKTDNTDSDGSILCNRFYIDRDGYLILNITNLFEYDLYNISFDIEFVGGILFFKANSETNAFVDHLPNGETVEVKTNDPVITPKPIIRIPLFLGRYLLTMDVTIDGTYVGQEQCYIRGLLIFLIVL